ncbi:lantibiotic dehydratase [Amycolatopsis magusensis]|uniref:lantibiotic dehydratase n=1 Tax=Amycolatopsis magusensis TaxID=882444 RepID=UPI00378BEC95
MLSRQTWAGPGEPSVRSGLSPTRFRALDFAIVRLSARSPGDSFSSDLWADPHIREAVEVSSPSLAATLDKISSGVLTDPARQRRAALSLNRYLARMTQRPTPFGLLAGVAAAGFGDQPKIRVGTGHRRHVRVDRSWLAEVLRVRETDPAVLPRLRVVRNDLCFSRGDRLVLPLVPEESGVRGPDDRERTIRHTRPVGAALEAAQPPIAFPALLARLGAEFPQADEEVLANLVTQLVAAEFLVTDLRPPSTTEDPIAHVLARGGHAPELAKVRDELARYAATPVGQGHEALRAATATMRAIHDQAQLLQVDLGMDADFVLPTAVADELASAAEVAWRVAPPRLAPADPLAAYRRDFIERYGVGTVVGIKDVLDPERGIGPPAGYLLPPGNRSSGTERPGESERDAILLELATRGGREVLLDEETIERLARPDTPGDRGSYAELCVQLLADSEDALRRGEFRLVGGGDVNFTRVGALFGRFLPLVPELRDKVGAVAADLVGGATPMQLLTPPLHPRMVNVTQVPRLTGEAVVLGAFAERPAELGLDDLGITAYFDRFAVVSPRDGREIAPLVFHSLNPRLAVPNAVRLLLEIGESHTPSWPLWHWGAAADLPYLPRIRHGRTVLSPARWLPDPRLREEVGHGEWLRRFEKWRAEWDVPRVVHATTEGERRIQLDLNSPTALELLRADFRKHPELVLREEPAGGEFGSGWADGHAAEVVVPVMPIRAERTRAETAPRPFVSRSYPPGGEWLYLRVYADRGRHAELLSRHLPALVEQAQPFSDRWFFLRYADPGHHLRIRFHGDQAALNGELLPLVHRWADELIGAGLIADLVTGTYQPEITRYGGPSAIEAAERAFHADSQCVLEQLALKEQGKLDLPMELLLAANHLELARTLCGDDGWQDWLLTTYPKDEHHQAFQRCRRDAVRLLGPGREHLSRELLDSWARRAPLLQDYARLIGGTEAAPEAFASMLHVHHNRLSGTGLDAEREAYAIARGVVRARRDRERQERR